MRKVRFGLIIVVIFIALIGGSFLLTQLYWQGQGSSVNYLNSLRQDLDSSPIDTSSFASNELASLPARIKTIVELQSQISQIPLYEGQRQAIIQTFQDTVDDYREQLVKALPFAPDFIPTDLNNFEFTVYKQPAEYLAQLKTTLRTKLVAYNQTAATPLRWQVDPQAFVAGMSLQNKVGQLFGFGINGNSGLSADERKFWVNSTPGTAVLFGNNITQSQIKNFTNTIQKTNPEILLLINTDQEGGSVKRVSWDTTGSQKQMAALSETDRCEAYKSRANLLASLGINWNLGIVADVTANKSSFIYPRVFSSSYKTAADYTADAAACTDTTLSTLKHFPGHGATTLDTHKVVATVGKSEGDWRAQDLLPFAAGITAGADTVMLGQIKLTWLDPDHPASLSTKNVDFLRNELKFEGLIVTDDMLMLERGGYTWQDALKQALQAGNDILLYSLTTSRRADILSKAIEYVKAGVISEAELNERVERILETKNKLVSQQAKYLPLELVY